MPGRRGHRAGHSSFWEYKDRLWAITVEFCLWLLIDYFQTYLTLLTLSALLNLFYLFPSRLNHYLLIYSVEIFGTIAV